VIDFAPSATVPLLASATLRSGWSALQTWKLGELRLPAQPLAFGRHAGHSHLLEATAPCMVGSFMILLLSWLGVRHLSKASRRTKVRVMIVLSWFR
jgi:hypothetical protein